MNPRNLLVRIVDQFLADHDCDEDQLEEGEVVDRFRVWLEENFGEE